MQEALYISITDINKLLLRQETLLFSAVIECYISKS